MQFAGAPRLPLPELNTLALGDQREMRVPRSLAFGDRGEMQIRQFPPIYLKGTPRDRKSYSRVNNIR